MVHQTVKIVNPEGMKIGPAGKFCETAMHYDCHIEFHLDDNIESNAKSMLSILGAGAQFGDVIDIICDGPDEEEALAALVELVEGGFADEEEQ